MDTRDVNPWEEHEKSEGARERSGRKGWPARRASARKNVDSRAGHTRGATGEPRVYKGDASTGTSRNGQRQQTGKDRMARRARFRGAAEQHPRSGGSAHTERTPTDRTSHAQPRRSTPQRDTSYSSTAQPPKVRGQRNAAGTQRGTSNAQRNSASTGRSAARVQRSTNSTRPTVRAPQEPTRTRLHSLSMASDARGKRGQRITRTSLAKTSATRTQRTQTHTRTISPARLRSIVIAVLIALIAVAAGAYFFFAYKGSQAATPHTDSATAAFDPVACTGADSVIDLSVDKAQLGAPVTFTLRIRNTDATHPCSLDVGSQKLDLAISSGDAALYSSAQCKPSPTSKLLLIPADSEATTTLTWNASAQCDQTGKAKAGSYTAEVTSTEEATLKDSLAFTLGNQ